MQSIGFHVAQKSRLDLLRDFERKLVFLYISYTKLNDYDAVSNSQFLEFAKECGIAAAIRKNALDKLCRLEIFSVENDAFARLTIKIHPSFYEEASLYYQDKLDLESEAAEWSPLQLDRSTSEAKQAIEATEQLLEALRGDNGFAANEPELTTQLPGALQAALWR